MAAQDGFDASNGGELTTEHELISVLLKEAFRGEKSWYHDINIKDYAAGKSILGLDRSGQCRVIEALTMRLDLTDQRVRDFRSKAPNGGLNVHLEKGWGAIWGPRSILLVMLQTLLRRKLPLDSKQLHALLSWIVKEEHVNTYTYPVTGVVKAVEHQASNAELDSDVKECAQRLVELLRKDGAEGDRRKAAERLEKVLGSAPTLPIQPGEAWADAALADCLAMDQAQQTAWAAFITHCQSATGGKPTAKWRKAVDPLLQGVGRGSFKECVLKWFPLVDKPRTQPLEGRSAWQPDAELLIIDLHADILRGLVWCCGFEEDKELARALTALAVSAYKKVPGIGPRAVRVGNACVYALGEMPGMEGVGQLALLKVKVKFGTAQKGIEKALNVTAERVGIPRDDLEEMGVPAYGLTEVGCLEEQMGDFAARLTVTGTTSTDLVWVKKDGKTQKSVPAAVKKDFADDLKDLKAAAKDIQKMLPAQRERIDSLYLKEKTWPFETWRQRYLDHPLVGTLARRIIWRFTKGETLRDGIYLDGKIVGHDDEELTGLGSDSTVALWHPLSSVTEDVVAWRTWLDTHQVRQPFKQAHREVYLLTDAERNTQVYSNRYAAHIVKQHQFNALCAAREWKNTLRLMVDDSYPPAHKILPNWELRAEFWVEGVGDEYGTDTNDTGTYYYLATDQVRFYRIGSEIGHAHAGGGGYEQTAEPLPLENVPPLVLSEILRDVDLFVGVASVGNDPTWSDGGPQGRYRDYWNTYSFGELSATAQTRKEVLERLIPRLKIAGRCSFSDKFLVVKGDVRTYKIHLGSGNILMEPNDQYLCIVPKQSVGGKGSDKVFLPFEGDNTMSIILSKAFLLAEDKKIKDSTIVSQIKG